MKITDLIEQIQQNDPELLKGIPEGKAISLIRAVFKHINEVLLETEEGRVKCSPLGQFRVRMVQNEDEKIPRKRIIFWPTKLGEIKTGN